MFIPMLTPRDPGAHRPGLAIVLGAVVALSITAGVVAYFLNR